MKSQTNTMHCFHYQLATLKKWAESVVEFYEKAKLLFDTLDISGKTLSFVEFIIYLLAGLESDFESVVTSVTTRVDPLSPSQVYNHLLTHEVQLLHHTHHLTSSLEFSANATSKQSFGNFSRTYRNSHDRGGHRV